MDAATGGRNYAAIKTRVPGCTVVEATNKVSSTIIVSITVALSDSTWGRGSAAVPVIQSWITAGSVDVGGRSFAAIKQRIPGCTVVEAAHKVPSTIAVVVTITLPKSTRCRVGATAPVVHTGITAVGVVVVIGAIVVVNGGGSCGGGGASCSQGSAEGGGIIARRNSRSVSGRSRDAPSTHYKKLVPNINTAKIASDAWKIIECFFPLRFFCFQPQNLCGTNEIRVIISSTNDQNLKKMSLIIVNFQF